MKRDKWLCLHISDPEEDLGDVQTFFLRLMEDEKFKKFLKSSSPDSLTKFYSLLDGNDSILDVEIGNDDFFLSQKRKWAFCILKNDKGDLDNELGITRKHFINKDLAKKWRNRMINEFHPDKNTLEPQENLVMITQKINKMYERMVGNA
jgi:hypothetical protein